MQNELRMNIHLQIKNESQFQIYIHKIKKYNIKIYQKEKFIECRI